MKIWRLKKSEILIALFILLLAMAMRVNAPRADLPSHITFSGSILTDEGHQCHNSRSKALYGEWFPDDWRITNYNPVLPWIKYGVFKVFGVGLFQLRLVNYFFAFLSLLFFFFTLRSYFHHHTRMALLGTFLLGINFLYVMYNKIGTFETSITFWVVMTLYFLEKYRLSRKGVYLFLSGAAAFMGFVFKSIMAYLLPLPFAAYLLMVIFSPKEKREGLKTGIMHLSYILLGILVLFVPWYIFHYLPNREWILSAPGQYMENLMFPRDVATALRNFLSFPWKAQFYKIPIVWLGAILYIPLFFRRLIQKRVQLTEAGVTLFFAAHTLVFFFLSYRPTRYFIPVIPAMVFLTTLWLQRILRYRPKEKEWLRPLERISLYFIDTIWLTLAAYFCFLPLIQRIFPAFPLPPLSYLYFIIAAAFIIGFHHLKKFMGTGKIFSGEKALTFSSAGIRQIIIGILLAVSLASDLGYYIAWNNNKTYSIRDISRELGEKFNNAYIAGMTAPAAVLENCHRALWLYPNFVNWEADTFKKYPLTHALLGTDVSREIDHFFKQWPQQMSHATLLKVFPLKDYFVHLYSFQEPYISQCTNTDGIWGLTVINPSQQTMSAQVGKVVISYDQQDYQKQYDEKSFNIVPGLNYLESTYTPSSPDSHLLIFLDTSHPFSRQPLRYEGENFSLRTGTNIKKTGASNQWLRYYDGDANPQGFLAYGPAVPFAPGVLVVDFAITFQDLKTRINPLCILDIYSQTDEKSLAKWEVRPSDIKKSRNNTYRLFAYFNRTTVLEFRIQVEPRADIAFDYCDVTYYQGYSPY